MDDAARSLADRTRTPMFDLSGWSPPASREVMLAAESGLTLSDRLAPEAERVADPLNAGLGALATSDDPALRALAERMRVRAEEMTREFVAAAAAEP